MLPARHRLRRRDEFSHVVRGGERAGATGVVVHVSRRPGAVAPRIGFVVGRTVGPATTRNRVRRRLRHLVAERLAGLPPGTELVVRATPAAAGMSFSGLGQELDVALRRIARRGVR